MTNIRQRLTTTLLFTTILSAGYANNGAKNQAPVSENPDQTSARLQDQAPEVQAADSANTYTDLLNKNRELWNQSSITQYTLDYFNLCFCDFKRVKVTVQDNKIVAVHVSSYQGEFIRDVPASEFGDFLNVEGLFDLIASAIVKADEVQVDYNPKFGYPESIYIDYKESTIDDESRYQIEFSRTQ